MSQMPPEPPASEVTPESLYLNRREFMANAARLLGTTVAVGGGLVYLSGGARPGKGLAPALDPGAIAPITTRGAAEPAHFYDTTETWTPYESVTSYNNFYEFGTDKSEPAVNAHTLRPRPWTVSLEGEIAKPQTVDVDTLAKWFPLEERVYRMRCVEAWSMVIPWLGFPLARLDHAGRADLSREVRRLHHAARPRADARPKSGRSSIGPTSRACASTRRCTR